MNKHSLEKKLKELVSVDVRMFYIIILCHFIFLQQLYPPPSLPLLPSPSSTPPSSNPPLHDYTLHIHYVVHGLIALFFQEATVTAHNESRELCTKQLEHMELQCSELSAQTMVVTDQLERLQANGRTKIKPAKLNQLLMLHCHCHVTSLWHSF